MSNPTQYYGLHLRELLVRQTEPVTIEDGQGQTFDIRGARGVVILPAAGATATYSKVDSLAASAHDTATDATTTTEVFAEKWAFIRVSTAGGDTRCCVVGP
jgi:hypothetical protein